MVDVNVVGCNLYIFTNHTHTDLFSSECTCIRTCMYNAGHGVYIVVAVHSQGSMRLACLNAACPVCALQLFCWNFLSKRHV